MAKPIIVTGATGKLGRHTVESLLGKVPPSEIVLAVRHTEKVSDFAKRGVVVRQADYDRPETLAAAFAGGGKLAFISASEVGRRVPQHHAVIDAAKQAGIELVAYTSILHCDRSGLALAREHQETERAIVAAGLRYVFLRNGWYFENYTERLAPALANGAFIGSAGSGHIAAAARADYAEALARVVTSSGHPKSYELAGDVPFTMSQLAAEVSRQTGKTIGYQNLPPEKYTEILVSVGLSHAYASALADSDVGITRGELDDRSGELQRLIGRATTTLATAVERGLAAVR